MERRKLALWLTTFLVAPAVLSAQTSDCDFERLSNGLGRDLSRSTLRGVGLGGMMAAAVVSYGLVAGAVVTAPVALTVLVGVAVVSGFAPGLRSAGQQAADQLEASLTQGFTIDR